MTPSPIRAALSITIALSFAATPAVAQQTGGKDIIVRGRSAGSSTKPPSYHECATLLSRFRAGRMALATPRELLIVPTMYGATRPSRNPDYSAPPKVPVGSPLPDVSRMGVGVDSAQSSFGDVQPGDDFTSEAVQGQSVASTLATNLRSRNGWLAMECERVIAEDRAMDQAASAVSSGGGGGIGGLYRNPFGSFQERWAEYRRRVVDNDTSLRMAFALFDQGRYAESRPYFLRASKILMEGEGVTEAYLFLGKLQLAGFGPTKDSVEAIKWLKKAADVRFAGAAAFDPANPDLTTSRGEGTLLLASIYERGMPGIPRDMVQACKWYERADDFGHVAAAKTLGDIYYTGADGVPRDIRKAVNYYRSAARIDLASAQVALARILEHGDVGVKPDVKSALAWYTRAAKVHEDPEAMFALAYDTGEGGVTADPADAFSLYKAAALKGFAPARAAIGTFFRDGTVVQQDEGVARRWFAEAAKARDANGMYYLAAMLANGRGGSRDFVEAWVWLQQAVALGQADAPAALAAVEARMTPADQQEARRRLKNGA